jgi:hypothetical protein
MNRNANEIVQVFFWLGVLAVCLSTSIFQLRRFVLVRVRHRLWVESLACLLIVCMTASVVGDWFYRSIFLLSASQRAGLFLALGVLALGESWLMLRYSRIDLERAAFVRHPIAWAALVILGVVTGLAGVRFQQTLANASAHEKGLGIPIPGSRTEVEYLVGVTDRGTRIAVYEWDAVDDEYRSFVETAEAMYDKIFPSLLREHSTDNTNCHGWVFTQGRYLLFGDEVELILRENGYQQVTEPRPDDVIIYRNGYGSILHSGIVRTLLDKQSVLVESKWGISARYLHLANDSPYGINFGFYRSQRRDHLIGLMPAFGFAFGVPPPTMKSSFGEEFWRLRGQNSRSGPRLRPPYRFGARGFRRDAAKSAAPSNVRREKDAAGAGGEGGAGGDTDEPGSSGPVDDVTPIVPKSAPAPDQ